MIKKWTYGKVICASTILLLAYGLNQSMVLAASSQSLNAGDVVITELMPNVKDSDVDWIEFFNATEKTIDLKGCVVSDENNDQIIITQSLVMQANTYAVIGSGESRDANLPLGLKNLAFQYSDKKFQLSTGPDQVILKCDNELIDKVAYASYRPGPAADSRGWQLEPNSINSVANDQQKKLVLYRTTRFI